jgi:beta-glucosidase/6-phospho-beta-glucosidase/beta-galactosidase
MRSAYAGIYATTYGIDSNPVNQVATMIENQEFNYYCTDVQVRGEYPAYAERMYQKYADWIRINAIRCCINNHTSNL